MAETNITFGDGQAYERSMGVWSRLAGQQFIARLNTKPGQRWLDVGCGNGAFTDLVIEQCAPAEIYGVDPAEGQLAFARERHKEGVAHYQLGRADNLPFPDKSFDIAVMALVIFFVPDPAKAVAEMARVVKPGGLVAAYAWDIPGGGFPFEAIQAELRAMGYNPPLPPSSEASRLDSLQRLWRDAGLTHVETGVIHVERTHPDFEDLWVANTLAASIRPMLNALSSEQLTTLKARMQERFPADGTGRITCKARANAVVGQTPR